MTKKNADVIDDTGIAEVESPRTKPAPKKRTSRKDKLTEAAEVHHRIAGVVKAEAGKIAQALIDRALNGDAAAAKYLFEFAGIFPTVGESNAEAKEEDSLAKTLMHRLNLPEEPIKLDEDEDGNTVMGHKDGEGAGEKNDCVTQGGAVENA